MTADPSDRRTATPGLDQREAAAGRRDASGGGDDLVPLGGVTGEPAQGPVPTPQATTRGGDVAAAPSDPPDGTSGSGGRYDPDVIPLPDSDSTGSRRDPVDVEASSTSASAVPPVERAEEDERAPGGA